MEAKTKLPQNINNLLMEIGEKSVLFELFLLTKPLKWDVFYNLSESGCDIIIINRETKKDIKIEVKTRQRIYTTGKNVGFSFGLTENEFNSIDFLVGYWYERHDFFIVPKNELAETTSNGIKKYYFRVTPNKDNSLGPSIEKYRNKWELIKEELEKNNSV